MRPIHHTGSVFRLVALGALLVVATNYDLARAQAWKPEQNVEIITGASPGGGNDLLARAIQRILQTRRITTVTSTVVNKVGGGNAVSWSYMNQHPGNGHYIALANPNLMTNHITGKSPLTYLDFTPIALLLSEYVTFLVRSDSPLKSGKELIELLRNDSGAISVSVGSALGGANHIALALIAKSIGADAGKLKTVVFNAQGEAMTALMGGHIGALSASASNAVTMLKAGKVRVLGISSPTRLGGVFAAVPTWKEQGVDAVLGNWRAIIGPRGLPSSQVAYWEDVFSQLAKTEDWQYQADTYVLQNTYLGSRNTAEFFHSQQTELQAILVELKLAR
jgi:putative tricarboxylic transport membrane protein